MGVMSVSDCTADRWSLQEALVVSHHELAVDLFMVSRATPTAMSTEMPLKLYAAALWLSMYWERPMAGMTATAAMNSAPGSVMRDRMRPR